MKIPSCAKFLGLLLTAVAFCSCASVPARPHRIVFIAGTPSHGHGEHEYRAGCLLLQKCLSHVHGLETMVYSNGWPSDPHALDGADAVVLSMDGGANHALLKDDHSTQLNEAMARGAGLACIHWAVEPTPEKGEKELIQWIGGAYEPNWSVNPTWTAAFTNLPHHPITRGVTPFSIKDEWYFHLRFVDNMKGVTPILACIPPSSTMDRPDGPHSGNAAVRTAVDNEEVQTVCWAYERPTGGRGFGFTGAHYHKNWSDENFRKVVLNGLLWIAHVDVPSGGVHSHPTADDLNANLDAKHH